MISEPLGKTDQQLSKLKAVREAHRQAQGPSTAPSRVTQARGHEKTLPSPLCGCLCFVHLLIHLENLPILKLQLLKTGSLKPNPAKVGFN